MFGWEGKISPKVAESVTGLRFNEIAYAEGFTSWGAFIEAYLSLNAHNLSDPNRKHYFIEFQIKEIC